MSTDEKSKGFRVTDRRSSAQSDEKPEAVEGPGWQMHDTPSERPLPPMDFTTFCLSLSSTALIQLGLAPDPEGAQTRPNLPLAKQSIDILELLEQKTQGNLTEAESKLLETLLYDLRMQYVQAQK